MKILMVNKFLYLNGGSETYILQIGNWLKEHGHFVEYFGMEHPERIFRNQAEQYTKNMDFHVGKWNKFLYPIKIVYSVEAKKKMLKVLKSFDPDVVHLNNFNYQLTPSILYAVTEYEKLVKRRISIIYTAHDYQLICPNHMLKNSKTGDNCENCITKGYYSCVQGKCIHNSVVKSIFGAMEGWLYRKFPIYKCIDRIICPSDFMASKMKLRSEFSRKTIIMHNYIEKVEFKRKMNKGKYVLYFGRLSEEKGINTLIQVCEQLPDIPFVIAGKGPLEEKIINIPNVTFAGFKKGKELENLIANASMSVYPSEWYENCPFSVMESQLYGTPVIGAAIGGIPELIKEGKTGLLFKSGDARDLKKKILELWQEPLKLQKFRENCRNVHFNTLDAYCERLLKLYRKEKGK